MHQSKKLTIISDTIMCSNESGYYSFGPVVRELEHIEHLFDEITWIGYAKSDGLVDASMKKIDSKKIKLVLLNSIGGTGFISFLKILLNYPLMFFILLKHIKKSNIIHTRSPSHPALIAILISYFKRKDKLWWNKYAGDWGQIDAPISYRFQRSILRKAKYSNVTINGFWPNQPLHCYSFENPCLTQSDIEKGIQIAQNKSFSKPFSFCFIGRFDDVKGVSILLKALHKIPPDMIDRIHLIGDGKNMNKYIKEAEGLGTKAIFHGFLEKNELHDFVAQSHFLLLPSKAEGFPKVVAEAACYGTIPIVSNVGSIKHYLNQKNGFVWDINSKEDFYSLVFKAVSTDESVLKEISNATLNLATLFTFDNYQNKLLSLVLKD